MEKPENEILNHQDELDTEEELKVWISCSVCKTKYFSSVEKLINHKFESHSSVSKPGFSCTRSTLAKIKNCFNANQARDAGSEKKIHIPLAVERKRRKRQSEYLFSSNTRGKSSTIAAESNKEPGSDLHQAQDTKDTIVQELEKGEKMFSSSFNIYDLWKNDSNDACIVDQQKVEKKKCPEKEQAKAQVGDENNNEEPSQAKGRPSVIVKAKTNNSKSPVEKENENISDYGGFSRPKGSISQRKSRKSYRESGKEVRASPRLQQQQQIEGTTNEKIEIVGESPSSSSQKQLVDCGPPCGICGTNFVSKTLLLEHLTIGCKKCPVCKMNYAFTHQELPDYELHVHHCKSSPGCGVMKCKSCSKLYYDYQSLRGHVLVHAYEEKDKI